MHMILQENAFLVLNASLSQSVLWMFYCFDYFFRLFKDYYMFIQGTLAEGEGTVHLTSWYQLASASDIANIIHFFTKQLL
jgi:hypothetical protein